MAPEQIERPERVDHRADLYSLGVVFYELLTGELPIGRFAVPSAKAEVNQRLDDVVLKTLEKEPDHRFQHASEIKTAVEAANLAAATDRLGEDSRQPRFSSAPALPFKTDDLYGGMAKGYGIARIRDPQTLEVEVEIQDFLGATKSPAKTVAVPIARLSSINFKPGVFSDTVSAQAETMAAVTDIPGAKRGLMKMYTSKSDSEIARQFVESVRQLLPSNRAAAGAHRVVAPTAPIKKGTADAPSMVPIRQEDRNALSESLRVPTVGMWITGLLHLGLAFFLISVLLRGALNRSDQFDSLFENVLRALGEFLPVANTTQIIWSAAISLGFAVLLFGVAWHLYRQRGYSLAFAGSILLVCTPIHPLALATLPLGIWALAVLDRPIARQIFRDQSFMNALPYPGSRGSVGVAWRWLVVAGLLFVLFAGGMGIILTSIAYTGRSVSEPAESATVTMVAEQQSGQVMPMDQPTGTVKQDPVNPAPPAAPATTVPSERVGTSLAGFILISLVAGAMAVVALVAILITVWWVKKREPMAGLSGRN
jgi:hypothetical protein